MGDRITFRERTNGVAVSNESTPPAVSFVEPRVKYVKGQVTTGTPDEGFVACGPETAYPMKVIGDSLAEKLDRIKEVFCRVNDAQFISGRVYVDDTYGDVPELTVPTTHPSLRAYEVNPHPLVLPKSFAYRGYQTVVEYVLTDDPFLPPEVFEVKYPELLSAGFDAGLGNLFREVSDSELAMWIPSESPKVPANFEGTNAFSYYAFNADDYNGWATFPTPDQNLPNAVGIGPDPCTLSVTFSGQIAYVLNSPEDSIFSPLTEFYIGVVFFAQFRNGLVACSSNKSLVEPIIASAGPKYIIRLRPEEDLTCETYISDSLGWVGMLGGGIDFVHKAIKWWPYKTTTGDDAWDTTTGLPANGGPGA